VATVVYVLYRTETVALDWVPDDQPIVLVHNDSCFRVESITHPNVVHLRNAHNIGFGAAVNAAAALATTPRLLLCNPDTVLGPEHWPELAGGEADEVRTVPLHDSNGLSTSLVNPYPSALIQVVYGLRLGRLARRGTMLRTIAARLARGQLGSNAATFLEASGEWPLAERWVCGAVMSIDRQRFMDVGGFDDGYFLYFEDVDLCRRLAQRFPSSMAVLIDTKPAVHLISHSSRGDVRYTTDVHHARSALRYARTHHGWSWRVVTAILLARVWWLQYRAHRHTLRS
jgi:N-acetylglucosaminyl-diphospho-decaprenol L-rhamnosyltransferase